MSLEGGAKIFHRANITYLSVPKNTFRLIRANIQGSRKGKRLSTPKKRNPQNPGSPQEKNTMTIGMETARKGRSDELMKVA